MIFKWWRAHQRRMDLAILWPVCKQEAPTLEHAKLAFLTHALNDTAWTKDYGREALVRYVDTLT